MRSHLQIIRDAGRYQKLAPLLGLPLGRVRFWEIRENIPPEYWTLVVDAGLSTLEELAAASAAKRPEQDAAA